MSFYFVHPRLLCGFDKNKPYSKPHKIRHKFKKSKEVIEIAISTSLTDEQIEELNDLQLLKEYLEKDLIDHGYKKQKAEATVKKLILSTPSPFSYHSLAWELGQRNIEFFVMFFLKNVFNNQDTAPIAEIHKSILKDIQETILNPDASDQQGYLLPRGTGKSVFGGLGPCLFSVCYGYKKYVLYGSSIGSTAEKFIKQMKIALENNPRIIKAFGEIYNPKDKRYANNATQMEFTSRGMIEAISSTSPMRGRKNAVGDRPDLIILDDYQDEDDCRTDSAKDNKWKRYSDDVKYAKQRPIYDVKTGKLKKQGTSMIALGTLQSKDDFYDRLQKLPTWSFRHEKGVLVDDVDEFFNEGLWEQFHKILIDKNQGLYHAKEFYYQNESEMQYPTLWSEFWNCLDLSLDYFESPASFKQEIQGDINSIGERKFKSIATESETEINTHNFTKTCLVIDPAKTRTKSRTKDYFAFAVCSQGDNNFKYIRKGEIFKFTKDQEYEEYIEHTLFLLRKYPSVTHLIIEKQTFGGADALRLQELINQDDKLRRRKIEIISFSQAQNKDDKINSIVGAVNLGQIIFNEDDEEAIEQLKSFAGTKFSKFDDFPDVVAEACKKIDEIEIKQYGTLYCLDKQAFGWNY